MNIRIIELPPDKRKELIALHRKERNKRNADRIKTIILLDKGYSITETAEILLLDADTISALIKKFNKGGIDELTSNDYQAYSGRLTDKQEAQLKEELKNNLFSTANEVRQYIRTAFGIEYSHDGTVKLLKRLGFVYKKTKAVPAKADRGKQEAFVKGYENTRKSLKKGEKIYFMDAMHPVHNSTPDYAWIEKGAEKEIKTVSGRNRLNVNGLYSPCDHETIIRSTDSVNAASTLELIRSISNKHPELTKIIIFHDNARYNHSKYLKERLPKNVEMRPLPSYSPNLNLIERLWKYFRKEVMNNHYHETFDSFKKSSSDFFRSLRGRKDDLDSLMRENFHLVQTS
jgi:transposase